MRPSHIESSLRERAERKRREGPARQNVQGFVRAYFDLIGEARAILTWDEIADVLRREGLRWGNGKPVSGKDLRTLFCRLRARNVPTRFDRMRPSQSPGSAPTLQKDRPSDAPAPSPSSERNLSKVVEEMNRAKKERASRPGSAAAG